jgi:hypothetical protein
MQIIYKRFPQELQSIKWLISKSKIIINTEFIPESKLNSIISINDV